MPPDEVFTNFWNTILDVIISSPILLLTVATAWVSGHLWAYILMSCFTKKERGSLMVNFIESRFGRIVLGLFWFSVVIIPVHFVYYRKLSFDLDSIASVLPNVIVFGLAIQALIFAIVNYLFKRRGALDD